MEDCCSTNLGQALTMSTLPTIPMRIPSPKAHPPPLLLCGWWSVFPQDMGNCQAQEMLTTEVLQSKMKRTVALPIRDVTPKGLTYGLTHTYATRISLSSFTQLTPPVQYNEHSYLALIPAAISSQLSPSH